MKTRERNKNLKTIKQLTENERNKIDAEFKRIYKLINAIKEKKYIGLKDNEFEMIIKNANKNLDEIAKTTDGYWAKYIVLTDKYIGLKTRNMGIWAKLKFN